MKAPVPRFTDHLSGGGWCGNIAIGGPCQPVARAGYFASRAGSGALRLAPGGAIECSRSTCILSESGFTNNRTLTTTYAATTTAVVIHGKNLRQNLDPSGCIAGGVAVCTVSSMTAVTIAAC